MPNLRRRTPCHSMFARTPQGHFAALITSLWGHRAKPAHGTNSSTTSSYSSAPKTAEQAKAAETLEAWDEPTSLANNTNTLLRNQNKYIQALLTGDVIDDCPDEQPDTDGWYGAKQVIIEDAYSVPHDEIRFPTVEQQLRRYGLNHRQSIAFVIVAARFLHMLTDASESATLARRATTALQKLKLDAQQDRLCLYIAGSAGSLCYITTSLTLHIRTFL